MAVAPYLAPFGAVNDAISVRLGAALVWWFEPVVVGALVFCVLKSVTSGSRRLKVSEGLGKGVS